MISRVMHNDLALYSSTDLLILLGAFLKVMHQPPQFWALTHRLQNFHLIKLQQSPSTMIGHVGTYAQLRGCADQRYICLNSHNYFSQIISAMNSAMNSAMSAYTCTMTASGMGLLAPFQTLLGLLSVILINRGGLIFGHSLILRCPHLRGQNRGAPLHFELQVNGRVKRLSYESVS